MSETDTLSNQETSRESGRGLLIAIGRCSFASLLLELGLTRLFSVVLFYYFAYLAVSIELLGAGRGRGVRPYPARLASAVDRLATGHVPVQHERDCERVCMRFHRNGMPARRGIGGAGEKTVEWAWGMNAASSVLGSVLAIVLAIHYGLNVALACAAGACLFAPVVDPQLADLRTR